MLWAKSKHGSFGMPRPSSQVVATVLLKDIVLGRTLSMPALTLKSLDGSLHRLKFKLGCFAQDGQATKQSCQRKLRF